MRAAKTREQQVAAYRLLADTAQGWGMLQILPFSPSAMERYEALWAMKLNVRKYDLRIAAIALDNGATVVTRNIRDFGRVPGLALEDWSAGPLA